MVMVTAALLVAIALDPSLHEANRKPVTVGAREGGVKPDLHTLNCDS